MEKYLSKITSILENHGIQRTKPLFEAEDQPQQQPQQQAPEPNSREAISNSVASEFFARARALATVTHFAHLSTDSYSEHSALATFYDDIIETIDSFCESYIGMYGKFISLPPITPQAQLATDAIMEFRDWISKNRSLITDDSSLQNIIDETVELCNTTIYKLQKLK